MVAAFVLGIEGREPALDVGVVADHLVEEPNIVAPVGPALGRKPRPDDLLPVDQLLSRICLVPDHAQYVKLRADLPLKFLQPAQDAGNRIGRRVFEQDRNQDVVGGRQGVDATRCQPRRAIDQNDVVVISQLSCMKRIDAADTEHHPRKVPHASGS